jgi:hypothetical protein
VQANQFINGHYYHVVRCQYRLDSDKTAGVYGIQVAALFHMKDGSRLISRNSNYTTASGQIGVLGSSLIAYKDRTTYYDIKLYLPQSEVPQGTGNYVEVDIRSSSGVKLASYRTGTFESR